MLTATDEDLTRRLRADNPWWDLRPGVKVTFGQAARRALNGRFLARVLGGRLPLVLCGATGPAKGALLRQTLAEAIRRRRLSPFRTVLLSLANPLYAGVPLSRLVERAFDAMGAGAADAVVLFVEDAEYLKDWETDVGVAAAAFPKVRLVVDVSSAAPGLVSGDTGDGRFEVFVLPALSFAEYVTRRADAGVLPGLDGGRLADGIALHAESAERLDALFVDYIRGVPAPGESPGRVPVPSERASLRGISEVRDLNALYLLIARNTGRELAIEGLAKETRIAKNTLRKYLDHLEYAFLIRRVPRLDEDGNRFQRQVSFKAYLTGAADYAALFGVPGPEDEVFPHLVETAVASQWFGDAAALRLAYASWKGGAVDLVTTVPGLDRPALALEIDWQGAYEAGDKGPETLARFAGTVRLPQPPLLLTRAEAGPASLGGREVTRLPAAVFAYWLGRGGLGSL